MARRSGCRSRRAIPKLPINPYGASKLMTERMLADAAAAHPFNYARAALFQRRRRRSRSGAPGQIGKGSTHLIKVAVEAAVGKRDHVDVFGTDYPTPDGTCIRDYIHVSDLAAAHVAALERLIEQPDENLVLNCGYGRGPFGARGARRARPGDGTPVPREIGPRRAGRSAAAGRRPTARLLETLDWRPRLRRHRHDRRPRARMGAQAAAAAARP